MAHEVVSQTSLDVLVRLLLPAQTVQRQTFHRQRFCGENKSTVSSIYSHCWMSLGHLLGHRSQHQGFLDWLHLRQVPPKVNLPDLQIHLPQAFN